MATKEPVENPLFGFVRLSSSIYIKEPTGTLGADSTIPSTIVLSSWMNAPPRIFVKFVKEYARLAPNSRIIFILNTSSHIFLPQDSHRSRLMPVVEAVRSTAAPRESVFLHIFSNGGSLAATHLLEAYRRVTGSSMLVPSMVIDSAPGRATIRTSAKALSYALPKHPILHRLCLSILYAFLVGSWVLKKVLRRPDIIELSRQALNDPELFGVSGAVKQRCYIYSDEDELINSSDVEEHASEAEASGWMVERAKFHGSAHVAHMRSDPLKYWAIIERYLRYGSEDGYEVSREQVQ
ncbi:conserved hypothetical protein [Paecilomyces variotii No. 5]|uniref:Indole-diterpene biosynthesis protein PaxU n=1 Tax=Byssochlamys spectabilis (strain No. 5 / NBRC 109023) TaxID=1356009 RepID=V5GAN9_BYSSN|nr:conserved hypothetical protein [Paecilomyces variotii No. 5]